MATVALIGADGAGKTTIARRLAKTVSPRMKYLYMGVNPDASSHALPTTRWIHRIKRAFGKAGHAGGPPDPAKTRPIPKGPLRRAVFELRAALRVANQLAEEWYRQAHAWYYERRGYVVLFDRHFHADYYAHDIVGGALPMARRIHGLVLDRLYPRPDLVILLDAPASVLHARKGEGSIELLERRRQEYLELGERVEHFHIVDATRPEEDVARDVLAVVEQFLRKERVR